jgi:Lrp/AsnC family transcriptional regulator for asnA, asnC and gidA
MMDKIDYMILKKLCDDANISNIKLAKEVGINPATAAKRVEAMLDKKLITIKAVPNYPKLGFNAHAFIALNVDLMSIDRLNAKLIESPNIHLVVTTFGRYDVILLAECSDWEKLNAFLRKEVPQWPGVKQTKVFLVADLKVYRDMHDNRLYNDMPVTLDDIDNKLVQILGKNGLTKYKDIAHELGVSPATVSRRVSILLKERIIKISAIPDPFKFGYSANAFILIETEHGKADEICAELNNYPQIHTLITLTSEFSFIAMSQFSNPKQLYEFIKGKISRIRGVSATETLIVSEYIKSIYTRVDFDNLP